MARVLISRWLRISLAAGLIVGSAAGCTDTDPSRAKGTNSPESTRRTLDEPDSATSTDLVASPSATPTPPTHDTADSSHILDPFLVKLTQETLRQARPSSTIDERDLLRTLELACAHVSAGIRSRRSTAETMMLLLDELRSFNLPSSSMDHVYAAQAFLFHGGCGTHAHARDLQQAIVEWINAQA